MSMAWRGGPTGRRIHVEVNRVDKRPPTGNLAKPWTPPKGVKATLDLLAKVPPGTFAGIIAQNDEDDRKFLESVQGKQPAKDSYLSALRASLEQKGLPTPVPDLSQPIPKDYLDKLDASQVGELIGVMAVVNLRKLSNDQ